MKFRSDFGFNTRDKVYFVRDQDTVNKSAEVLVIEDDPQDAFFLRRAFSKAGLRATVWVAVDGSEARLRLSSTCLPPDLVILDLTLPGESGLTVLRWLKEQPGMNDLPVVVLTGSADPSDQEWALKLGAAAYIRKPMDWVDLAALAHSIANKAFMPEVTPPFEG
jgi:CheY-like chemotaxis protein